MPVYRNLDLCPGRTMGLREENVPALGYTLSSGVGLGIRARGLCPDGQSDYGVRSNAHLLGGCEDETKRRANRVSGAQ